MCRGCRATAAVRVGLLYSLLSQSLLSPPLELEMSAPWAWYTPSHTVLQPSLVLTFLLIPLIPPLLSCCVFELCNVQKDEGGVINITRSGTAKTAQKIRYGTDAVIVSKMPKPGEELVCQPTNAPINKAFAVSKFLLILIPYKSSILKPMGIISQDQPTHKK